MRTGDWQYSPAQIAFSRYLHLLRRVYPDYCYPNGVAHQIRHEVGGLRLHGDPWLGCWRD